MTSCAFPVILAFILNRFSVRYFSSCRCTLGFTPSSASIIFGLALVVVLVKHPQLYPCWLRRVNVKIMFLYEFIVSLVIIEVGYCLWNSFETFLFFKLPSFFEEHCSKIGDYYINIVENPVGVSIISNSFAIAVLLLVLHVTKVCNFGLLLKKNGIHKFFADAGLTSNICRHHKLMREYQILLKQCNDESEPESACCPTMSSISRNSETDCLNPKMLRSGKKVY